MRDPHDKDTARRFVACDGWRWIPGMEGTTPDGFTILIVSVGYSEEQEHRGVAASLAEEPRGEPIAYVIDGDILRDCDFMWDTEGVGALPDLGRSSTMGCVQELVREALGIPMVDLFEHLRPAMGRGVPMAEALLELFEVACVERRLAASGVQPSPADVAREVKRLRGDG